MSTQSRINKGTQALRAHGHVSWSTKVDMSRVTPETGLTNIVWQVFGSLTLGYQRMGFKHQRDLQRHGFATKQPMDTEEGQREFQALHKRWCKAAAQQTA